MEPEKVPCRNPTCQRPILPATAQANGGLCARCLAAEVQAKREEHIRNNRRTVNLYEGIDDPVEVICLSLTYRRPDPLITYLPAPKGREELFLALDELQARRLADRALHAWKSGNENLAEEIVTSLATLTRFPFDALLLAGLDAGHFWPAVAYRNAGMEVRDRLIAAIHAGETDFNAALSALAWIGDRVVQYQFTVWENDPPAWRQQLFVGPAAYADIGGWELVDGDRRDLAHDDCLVIEIATEQDKTSNVRLVTDAARPCPFCGGPLSHVLEIPTAEEEFWFIEFQGPLLKVLSCERCVCFAEHLYARIRPDGSPEWHEANQTPEFIGKDEAGWPRTPWPGIAVKTRPGPPLRAVPHSRGVPATQVGGQPAWEQDAAYPKCPECVRTMRFIAQVDRSQFKYQVGLCYAFLCAGCRITAVGYQQT